MNILLPTRFLNCLLHNIKKKKCDYAKMHNAFLRNGCNFIEKIRPFKKNNYL